MKWIANVTAFKSKASIGTNYSLFPIEADSQAIAAQSAAKATACLLYQNEAASVGFVNRIAGTNSEDHGLFRVCVGLTDNHGVINGHTLEILIREYRGNQ